ncbi:hypothetical protein CC78DRAFT_161809 [Lojkania enalia]|uniref:Uncharacterized protein n=1 Tax=Lojkania enalia TaxID=147567 RepID=A0A9P4KBI8_9PLEO|nr:hypothetical protein CC78DRAFT_161809 [Didymosphaeria enalia]
MQSPASPSPPNQRPWKKTCARLLLVLAPVIQHHYFPPPSIHPHNTSGPARASAFSASTTASRLRVSPSKLACSSPPVRGVRCAAGAKPDLRC